LVLPPVVQYGTTHGTYTRHAHGALHTYSGATVDVSDVELTGLNPDTKYYYRCGDSSYGWSAEKSFSTPPESGEGFEFCAFGDSRDGVGPTGDNSNFEIWRQIANAVSAENPQFCLFAGDAVTTATSEPKWNAWYDWLGTLSTKSPIMFTHGNHEGYQDAYFKRLALPGNER
jgi:phosphodiesterase/alkaline phosphatase D-like protein